MSKVTVALVSFALGTLSTFVAASGSHISTLPQLGGSDDFIPKVPLLGGLRSFQNTVSDMTVRLDGANSTEDNFNNVVFLYGGGPVRLVNPSFSGRVELRLEGCAANTASTVAFFNLAASGGVPKPPVPRQPITQTAELKHKISADLTTPYGQK